MRALHLEAPNFARKPQILCGGTQIFDWKPLINPRKHKFSLGNVRPPFGEHARSIGHGRHPFGTRALRSACTRCLGHVRPTFGTHSLIPACAPSPWPARAPSGMRSQRLACVHPLGARTPPIRPTGAAFSRPHLCAHSLGMCAPSPLAPLQNVNFGVQLPPYPSVLLSFRPPLPCGIVGCALTWHVRALACARPHLACAHTHLECARPHLACARPLRPPLPQRSMSVSNFHPYP